MHIWEPRPLEEQILEVLVITIREGKNPNDAYNDLSPMARAKMEQFANFMIRRYWGQTIRERRIIRVKQP